VNDDDAAAQLSGLGPVLVTGAGGFLGSHVVELLSSRSEIEVVATDLVATERTDELARLPRVRFAAFDLRDTDAVAGAMAGCRSVVHLAGALTNASAANPRLALEVNVGVTHDLAALAAAHGLRRFVYGSSHAVYGTFQERGRRPFVESDAAIRLALSPYGASKLAAEAFLCAFTNAGGPQHVALRFGTIYGPRINPQSNGAMLLRILSALDAGHAPQVNWAREAVHGLIHVADAAEATWRALFTDSPASAINVVGDPVTSEALYGTLVEMYGGDPDRINWQSQRTRFQHVSRELLAEALGFQPTMSLRDGLRTVIDWHRELRGAAA
jgi:nucleoside-diphosphate-sugar epimerase